MTNYSRAIPFRHSSHRGFTLVELLIVIVIIGILATLTVVGYNGVVNRTHQATLQQDLDGASDLLGASITQGSSHTYPGTLANATALGVKASSGDTLAYNVDNPTNATSYCLEADGWGYSYFITSTSHSGPTQGYCSGVVGVASTTTRPQTPSSYTVSTLAGSGTAGFKNGTGTAAQFNDPRGVAVDSSGNIYIGDQVNDDIRKITPAGVVTTFAGTGSVGTGTGTGTTAQFQLPQGVAFDTSGNLYVADSSNDCIRKLTSAAVETTLAGVCSLTTGYADGTGSAARFYYPRGIAVNASGTIYVGDTGNNVIRKITSAGVVTTFAGSGSASFTNGTGTSATFNAPRGVAVDSSGNVYVADTGNNVIRKITSAGVVTTFAGSGSAAFADGTGTAASFNGPYGLAVDSSGNIYVADTGNNRIRKITSAGVVTTIAGTGTASTVNGSSSSATFNGPAALAFDSSGNIYVVDHNSSIIRKLAPSY